MTITAERTFLDAVLWEPIELIKAQPPQIFVSIASAYLIAAEANVLLPTPINWALAIGAEWGYLRGLASAAHVETTLKRRLTVANAILVVAYGALFSLREFGALPSVADYRDRVAVTSTASAIVMTAIHIACIGAITLCAMMAHAAMLTEDARVKRLADAERNQRNQRNQEETDARNREWAAAQLELEIEKQRQRAILEVEAERNRQRLALAAERNRQRSATTQAVAAQPDRNQLILYNGVAYPSIQAAADAHGISRQAMAKRLKKEALI